MLIMKSTEKICPISGDPMAIHCTGRILGKYDVPYYYCASCGLLQTEEPYWLDEAYESAISSLDTGIVYRNLINQSRLEPILYRLFGNNGRFLDVGGGYGLLTRLLRDRGFNCYSYDKYCKNLFAGAFEPEPHFKADCLLSFEVFEHIVDPLGFLARAFTEYSCRSILFSTTTFEGAPPAPDWNYYAPESGQHITFYQERSLAALAGKLGCRYVHMGSDLHWISEKELTKWDRLWLLNHRCAKFYGKRVRKKRRHLSLVGSDQDLVRKMLREKQ